MERMVRRKRGESYLPRGENLSAGDRGVERKGMTADADGGERGVRVLWPKTHMQLRSR